MLLIGRFAKVDIATLPDDEKTVIRALLFRWDGLHIDEICNKDSELNNAAVTLQKKGFVVIPRNGMVRFVVPLMHFHWCSVLRTAPAVHAPNSIDALIEDLVRNIKPAVLRATMSRAPSSPQPLEVAWQMEVYRAAYACLPASVNVSPGFGHGYGSTGAVDFLVNGERGWAIEIMREGDRRKEHLARFAKVRVTPSSTLTVTPVGPLLPPH